LQGFVQRSEVRGSRHRVREQRRNDHTYPPHVVPLALRSDAGELSGRGWLWQLTAPQGVRGIR
jgi:hypothetical protein